MSTRLDYYFSKLNKFPFPDFFDGVSETYELLAKAKPFLNEFLRDKATGAEIRENRGVNKGEAPALYNACFIGEGTVIYNDVTVIGPAYIGKNCELQSGSLIRPGTIIADGCSVGHGSEVKHTIMFGGSKVASLSFVGDSILGAGARVGSGVITANRRFDQQDAVLKLPGGDFAELGDSFFGCVLGDSSRLGANCVPSPGTHIGQYCWILPLTSVRGFIPSETRVMNNAEMILSPNARVELKP